MSDPKDKTNSPPPTGKTLALLQGGQQIKAIVPTTVGEAFSLAEMVHSTGLAPDSIKTAQALCVVFLKGMEIGLLPMAAMESIGIINGRACLYGDGIPSLLWARGFTIKEWYENDSKLDECVAHCQITRPDGSTYSFAYSAQDAKDNGLWDTREKDSYGKPNKSPWFKYRKRMLRMRCRGWLARDCASDVLKGMPVYEEQADLALDRSEYREVKPATLAVPDNIPDETTVGATVSEAEDNQDALIAKPEQYLEQLEEGLLLATDEGDFDVVWANHEELVEAGRLTPDDVRAADALHAKHSKRFA